MTDCADETLTNLSTIESATDLPDGWAWAGLQDICDAPQYGWTTRGEQSGAGLRLLRTSDISQGDVNWDRVPACACEPAQPEKYLLRAGDILVSRAGSVGLSYLVEECPPAVFASYLIRFRPQPPVPSRFIRLFLRSPAYWSAIADASTGIAIPNVNASKLKRLAVPVPPLAEQKRIVEKVEELLAQVDSARERLAKVPEIMKRFRQSVLAAACSGQLTADWRASHQGVTAVEETVDAIAHMRREGWSSENRGRRFRPPKEVPPGLELPRLPETWKYVILDGLLMFVTSGSRGWARYYADSGPVFVRVGNLDHDSVDLDLCSVQHVDPPDGAEGTRTLVRTGDILVSITADVGMVALADSDLGEAYVNQHVAIARPVEGFSRRYVAWFLASREGGQAQFEASQRGATKAGLGLDDIRQVAVPFPPIEEQHQIVRRAEALFRIADAIEKRVAAAAERADKLTQAILAKAFRGELVPTEAELARREGRSYESAEEFLTRIRTASCPRGGAR